MTKTKYIFLLLFLTTALLVWVSNTKTRTSVPQSSLPIFFPTPTTMITLKPYPAEKILNNNYHIYQTFNNCGPAALSMALSYYKISKTQEQLGEELRPYQNQQGINDDKSVTLAELAEKSKEYDLIPYHRPNGTITLLKKILNYDIPVITRTWTEPNQDIGHFRIIKGYNDSTNKIIQDDSLQGNNLEYSYNIFNILWEKFNFEYLVLANAEKKQIVEAILQEDIDPIVAWQKAASNSQKELENNPQNIYSRFNLSVAYYNSGDYQNAVSEFEKVEYLLPFRTLWYQLEPLEAYYELGNYERVIEISERIINNQNRAFSELYVLRGKIYQNQNNITAAKEEFAKAVFYNRNQKQNQELLDNISY